MNRTELVQYVKSNRDVTIQLTDAEIVSKKHEYRKVYPNNRSPVMAMVKMVVKDPVFGAIYFSTFSDKFDGANKGDKISVKVTVTGIGDASE